MGYYGWDPEECTGDCELCEECLLIMEQRGDQEYEAWRQENSFASGE